MPTLQQEPFLSLESNTFLRYVLTLLSALCSYEETETPERSNNSLRIT